MAEAKEKAEKEIAKAKEEARKMAEIGLTEEQEAEAAEHIKAVMKAYDLDLDDAKEALGVEWTGQWCPVLPDPFQGDVTSLCEKREDLEDLAASVGIGLSDLLGVISEEDLA